MDWNTLLIRSFSDVKASSWKWRIKLVMNGFEPVLVLVLYVSCLFAPMSLLQTKITTRNTEWTHEHKWTNQGNTKYTENIMKNKRHKTLSQRPRYPNISMQSCLCVSSCVSVCMLPFLPVLLFSLLLVCVMLCFASPLSRLSSASCVSLLVLLPFYLLFVSSLISHCVFCLITCLPNHLVYCVFSF